MTDRREIIWNGDEAQLKPRAWPASNNFIIFLFFSKNCSQVVNISVF